MLFDQQSYILFLEYFSPDGNISNIHSVFFRVQISIALISILWSLIDQTSIDLMVEHSLHNQDQLDWQQNPLPYIAVCIIWLLISYLPFLFLEGKTIISLIKEDSFYQNCGALWLFISSILFFYLFYKKREPPHLTKLNKGRNIWFLLLGLLFFFGAGEEISWGQRIFDFETPEFMASNIQGEFSVHNLPWFDGRSEVPYANEHGIWVETLKTGFIETRLTASSLLFYFCFSSLVALPFLYLMNNKARVIADTLRLPIAPIYSGILFMIVDFVKSAVSGHYRAITDQAKLDMAWDAAKSNHSLAWGAAELYETYISFLFMIIAMWFINNYKASLIKQD